MKKLLLVPAALALVAGLSACSGDDAPGPQPTATEAPTQAAPQPTVGPAATGVPLAKDDGTKVPVDAFAAPVLSAAPELAKVYTKPELVKVAADACQMLGHGAIESDVVKNARAEAQKKAAAAGVDPAALGSQIDTLLGSGARSYCPEFQIGGEQPTPPRATSTTGPRGTVAPSK